jgi:hypothetical protein
MTPVKCANFGVARNCSDVTGGGCAAPSLLSFVFAAQPQAPPSSTAPINSLHMMRRPTICFMTIVNRSKSESLRVLYRNAYSSQ